MDKLHGYIEIDVKGDKVPLKFGLYAIDQFCEKLNVSLGDIYAIDSPDNIFNKSPLKAWATVIWAGANYASIVTSGREYTLVECFEILEKIGLGSDTYNSLILKWWESFRQDESDTPDDKPKIKKNKE